MKPFLFVRQKETPPLPSWKVSHRRTTNACKTPIKALRRLFCLLMAALLLSGCAGGLPGGSSSFPAAGESAPAIVTSAPPSQPASPPSEPEPQPVEHRIRFSAVGDNLIHNSIYESAAEKAGGDGYDFSYAYENVRGFLADFDINWINQETLVNDEIPAATYPCFSTPGQLGQAAYDAGWRVFALSNNHTYDQGTVGIGATRRYWAGMPQDVITYGLFTGIDDDSGIAIHGFEGLTIAYVAFTEHTNGLPTPLDAEAFVIYTSETAAMEAKVRRARELADIVVVSVHWGVEDSHNVVDGQRGLAQSFADWGADVVIGTHPHVIQEMEWVQSADGRQVLVAYSLGNFLSAQSKPDQLIGLALTFDFVMTEAPDGSKGPLSLENVRAYPTVTQYEYDGGPHYNNPRSYLYRDYTDNLAAAHRVRTQQADFGRDYIAQVCKAYISEEFLVLE